MESTSPDSADTDPFVGEAPPLRTALERAAIRTRESSVTRSAWRMSIHSARGTGAITLVELDSGPRYRGEGRFLGWNQAELTAAYRRLLPPPEAAEPDSGQWG